MAGGQNRNCVDNLGLDHHSLSPRPKTGPRRLLPPPPSLTRRLVAPLSSHKRRLLPLNPDPFAPHGRVSESRPWSLVGPQPPSASPSRAPAPPPARRRRPAALLPHLVLPHWIRAQAPTDPHPAARQQAPRPWWRPLHRALAPGAALPRPSVQYKSREVERKVSSVKSHNPSPPGGTPDPTSPQSPSTSGTPDPTSPPSTLREQDFGFHTAAGLRGCDAGAHPAAAGLHGCYAGSHPAAAVDLQQLLTGFQICVPWRFTH
ncbi:anther-specific proline-rich protein APG-like [Panicum hallii]|uniref:anther-specific proline-rich protein APG-like n=1 Tax=Panicum hallii TaxID=206008 RepID=UPI000DF4E13A|nr:anther-specific proline-rich protein APG-like [Panicum hallii]